MKKKKRKTAKYNEVEDYQDIERGGQRRNQRKKKRYNEKRYLKDMVDGAIDPDDYQDYMEAG